jgi:hypothetical protein
LYLIKILIPILFLLCSLADKSFAQHEQLISRVKNLNLSQTDNWKSLLHLDSTLLSSTGSTRSKGIDFVTEKDLENELIKTTIGFLSSEPISDNHLICKYPARYKWLSTVLPELGSINPVEQCPSLKTWYQAIDAQKVSVIFPASFLNNPASAFGHTFIRFDQPNQTEQTRLLAYAVDYAAQTQGDDALSYAFKGIFGGYSGLYSVSPFYKKVTQYSDLENRDIWEYQLAFTPEEVSMLVLHVWELRNIPFTYYYFDENCSYHILALLDVARPSLQLTRKLRTWVIPIDTIRVLDSVQNLVGKKTFRPSAVTKLKQTINSASHNSKKTVSDLLSGNFDSIEQLDKSQKAQAIDLAYEYQTYQRIKSGSENPNDKQIAWNLLRLRSQLGHIQTSQLTEPAKPETGHKSAQLGLGLGFSDQEFASEVSIRPAFHSLSDPIVGYPFGSEIKFFDTSFRVSESDNLNIEKFTALQITSLSAVDEFLNPLSWQVRLHGERVRTFQNDIEPFVFYTDVGFGKSIAFDEQILLYGLLSVSGEYTEFIEDGYSIGAGPTAGLVWLQSDDLALEISHRQNWYGILGDVHMLSDLNIGQRISISNDNQLKFEFGTRSEFGATDLTYMLRWQLFFTP